MKVQIVVSVDVDLAAWNKEYGQRETPAQVRESIKASIAEVIGEPFRHLQKTVYGEQKPDGFIPYTTHPIVTTRVK